MSTGETPAITFRDVVKRYGSVVALDRVGFAVQRGEVVALLGPNGAGKTTAVEVLLGLRRADSGEVRVLGASPTRAVTAGRVGAMLQQGSLPGNARVGEVLGLARALYGRRHSLADLLSVAGLTGAARRQVDTLSGGQAQRLRFALALAGEPDLLFLDEPTVSLDVAARREFWRAVGEVAAGGATILFTTHYLEEADENAGRIVVLHQGRVVADGPPSRIKSVAAAQTVRCVLDRPDPVRLAALPGVADVQVRGREVELRCTDADAAVAALFAAGEQVQDLRVTGADLAAALLAMTGEE